MIKQQYIDYFKLFKIYDLKKLQKTGQVKIIQDKIINRKILSVQGTVSTQNFTNFICSSHPNIHFKQQYLYLQAYSDPGKAFNFQITYFISNKQYKLICSTMYKEDFKKKSDTLFHFKLKMPSDKWTIITLDLYSLVNWDQSFKNDQDLRLVFKISNIQIRANSKLRGMFQSDILYGPQNLPKQMELPLRGQQMFFEKFAFIVTGFNLTEQLKNEIQKYKQNIIGNQIQNKKRQPQKAKTSQKNSKSIKQINQEKSQKSQSKFGGKDLSKQKIKLSQQKTKNLKKSISAKTNKTQKQRKDKNMSFQNHQQFNENELDQDVMQQQVLQPPKPAASISLKIEAIEAISIVYQNIISCQSFLIEPVMLQTHKKITKIYKSRLGKVLTSYFDGSICLWDTIRKQSLFYFRSQLQQIRCLLMDYDKNIIIVGLDKLKREVIEIVSQEAIIFKQISNFNIKTIKLVSQQTFEQGLISIGYQNIRIWTISPNNNIINGYSVYLGKMARSVTYNDCCIVQTIAGTYAFVCDSEGYVTKINISEKKMEGVVKVDNCGIDHIRLIKYLNNEQKILVANQKGTIKLLSCTTMESQLEYPLNNRIKSIFFKQSPKHDGIPNLVLQTFNKTLAELDLIDSSFHFIVRSHYQQISHIEYEKSRNKNTSFYEDKIITASSDSTMRVWKRIKTSDIQIALKEEYQFLINGETITHICSCPGIKQVNGFVYMITNTNKIRKISISNYQIVIEKSVPSINNNSLTKVLSFSINQQGKILLIVCSDQILLLNQELEVLQFKNLTENYNNKQINKLPENCLSGFNSYKKSLYFQNHLTQIIQFYRLKDIENPLFNISSPSNQKIISLQWENDTIHCITDDEYQMYDKDNLLRVIPFKNDQQLQNDNKIQINVIVMNYPMLCISYTVKQTEDNYVSIQVLNKNGISQKIKMPQQISKLKITKPLNSAQDSSSSNWEGDIICAGSESFGMYSLKYSINNVKNLMSFNDNTFELENNIVSFMGDQTERKTAKIPKIQAANISFISNSKQQNNLDISFSETATLLMGHKGNQFFNGGLKSNKQINSPPAQLRKLYEQEQKVFEQCKKAVFGDYFDQNQNNGEKIEYDDQVQEQQKQRPPQNGKIKLKVFFGVDTKQSLLEQVQILNKRKNNQSHSQLGQFYWNSGSKLFFILTNQHKSLLIHEFTQPSISHRLLHLYSKPTSICWSPTSSSQSQIMNYFVICYNSIIKLYNASNNMSYIRTIEADLLIKDKHVVFSSFITNCNSFLVALTYKLQDGKQVNIKQDVLKPKQNKLYIFVIQLSSRKIISSSYRDIKYLQRTKNRFDYQKCIRQTYEIRVNRYSANKQLQFILKGTNQLAFYRVTSMFTLQMLELEQAHNLTKQKTQNLTTAKYIKVQGDIYLLIGTQNGSVIIIDSRSGSIVLVLMNLLSNTKGSTKNETINKIQFIEEQLIDNQIHVPSKLIFFTKGSNSIKVIILENGLNTLIKQVQTNSTTIITNQSFSTQSMSNNLSLIHTINLDSQIASVSTINNTTQQLVLTKCSSLWLVDYDDFCSIKIFSAHSEQINEAYLLKSIDKKKHFISCSEDGYVKVSDTSKIQQLVQIYKPRKQDNCLQIQGNYTVCGFKDQIYFYDALGDQLKNFSYLGSLQFQHQNVLKIKNIPFSDNYYILTDQKVYVIYVKRKKPTNTLSKSQISTNSQTTKNYGQNFEVSTISKGINGLPKVQIQIQIQQISLFLSNDQSKGNLSLRPIWLQINSYRPYDEFSIGFRGGKVDSWQRKCLKRTLNPLQQLSNVQNLQYYLIDVYNRKQVLQPCIQFISERQYMISLSELNKIQIRNYKQHSIIKQIVFSQQFLQGIKTFKYYIISQNKLSMAQSYKQETKTQHKSYFNNLSSTRKGPLILIGDQFGYFNVCDMNGLVIEKQKVFNSPIQSIQVDNQNESQSIAFSVFLKSSHYLSLLQVYQ